MAAATDPQMQTFADQRVRPVAELGREFFARMADDKNAIDDVYARAISANRWNDGRDDGPPTLMQSGDSANPDHMLVYNTIAEKMAKVIAGTATAQDIADIAANWPVLMDCCVRPLEG